MDTLSHLTSMNAPNVDDDDDDDDDNEKTSSEKRLTRMDSQLESQRLR